VSWGRCRRDHDRGITGTWWPRAELVSLHRQLSGAACRHTKRWRPPVGAHEEHVERLISACSTGPVDELESWRTSWVDAADDARASSSRGQPDHPPSSDHGTLVVPTTSRSTRPTLAISCPDLIASEKPCSWLGVTADRRAGRPWTDCRGRTDEPCGDPLARPRHEPWSRRRLASLVMARTEALADLRARVLGALRMRRDGGPPGRHLRPGLSTRAAGGRGKDSSPARRFATAWDSRELLGTPHRPRRSSRSSSHRHLPPVHRRPRASEGRAAASGDVGGLRSPIGWRSRGLSERARDVHWENAEAGGVSLGSSLVVPEADEQSWSPLGEAHDEVLRTPFSPQKSAGLRHRAGDAGFVRRCPVGVDRPIGRAWAAPWTRDLSSDAGALAVRRWWGNGQLVVSYADDGVEADVELLDRRRAPHRPSPCRKWRLELADDGGGGEGRNSRRLGLDGRSPSGAARAATARGRPGHARL